MSSKDLLQTLTQYICHTKIDSLDAIQHAQLSLADSLGCALLALQFPACTRLLGPWINGYHMQDGCPIPGTSFQLDPVLAAFNIGTMIRWLDFNDTWLGKEWAHPSDNFGGILAAADYGCKIRYKKGLPPLKIRDVLLAAIKAYEIQGCLALENSFNEVGLDHVILVKIATAGIVTHLLGGSEEQVLNALSQAFMDNGPLRAYRHTPNTGSRKSWAAGDATSRGVWLALLTLREEPGYPHVLKTSKWGFEDVVLHGTPLVLTRDLESYIIENILYKVSYPAEFHAQTALEAAIQLHHLAKNRIGDITSITIDTHDAALRIIDKKGPLKNPADRDHCIQYIVALGLLHGTLKAEDYEDEASKDLRIDQLREKMEIKEHFPFTQDYLDPQKRSIASTIRLYFNDNTHTPAITVEYPIGHRKRREEALPLIWSKCLHNLSSIFDSNKVEKIYHQLQDLKYLEEMPASEFMAQWKVRE